MIRTAARQTIATLLLSGLPCGLAAGITLPNLLASLGGTDIEIRPIEPGRGSQSFSATFQPDRDASGIIELTGVVTPGKRYTRTVTATYRGPTNDTGILDTYFRSITTIATECFSLSAPTALDVNRWVSEQARETAAAGGGSFESSFGPVTTITRWRWNVDDSVTIATTMRRPDMLATNSWARFCTLR